jgi:hypothetical protein
LNWADFSQPVNELDQTADHPALAPSLAILDGEKKRQIILADLAPPKILAIRVRRPWCDVRGEVWFGSFLQRLMVFMMISPNLHYIWVMFFLILSQELKLVLLMYFGTLGDGYSL